MLRSAAACRRAITSVFSSGLNKWAKRRCSFRYSTTGTRRRTGVGILEAPRGTLFHHYEVNDNDQIEMANLIVSTTSNNEPMNRAVESVAREHLSGKEITEGLLNHVEVAIRAYDPCLSCATHAAGQMPLIVTVQGPDGAVLARRER